MRRIFTVATAPVVLVVLLATNAGSHDPVASASWTRDVEPIVRARCFACHRTDGPALPTLASAEDFRTHRAAVKDAILTRRMPLWSAVRGFGAFDRDRSLSPLQISLIASWIESGAPGSRVNAGDVIVSRALPAAIPRSGRRIRLELPAFRSKDGVQRDVVTLPGSGRIAVTGWRFVAGHPSVGHVRIRDSQGRLLWTASPEFELSAYPEGTGLGLSAPFQFVVESFGKRLADDPAVPAKTIASHLEIDVSAKRVTELETVTSACGSQPTVKGTVYALRPDLSSEASMEVRTVGAAPRVLGLFRGPTNHLLAYWLRTPLALDARTRLTVAGKDCTVDIIVGARNRAEGSWPH